MYSESVFVANLINFLMLCLLYDILYAVSKLKLVMGDIGTFPSCCQLLPRLWRLMLFVYCKAQTRGVCLPYHSIYTDGLMIKHVRFYTCVEGINYWQYPQPTIIEIAKN